MHDDKISEDKQRAEKARSLPACLAAYVNTGAQSYCMRDGEQLSDNHHEVRSREKAATQRTTKDQNKTSCTSTTQPHGS
jgi:hypothetical protein